MEPCLVPDVTAAPMTTPIPPLGSTVLRGLVWLGGVRWAAQLFTWGSTLVIARLLAPEDYGLVALGTVLTGFLEVITDLGLGSALVQRQDLIKRDIEATMGVTCALGAGAALLVALSASLWARLQGDPRIVSIVQARAPRTRHEGRRVAAVRGNLDRGSRPQLRPKQSRHHPRGRAAGSAHGRAVCNGARPRQTPVRKAGERVRAGRLSNVRATPERCPGSATLLPRPLARYRGHRAAGVP